MNDEDLIEKISENFEFFSRITPTSMPEWMD